MVKVYDELACYINPGNVIRKEILKKKKQKTKEEEEGRKKLNNAKSDMEFQKRFSIVHLVKLFVNLLNFFQICKQLTDDRPIR